VAATAAICLALAMTIGLAPLALLGNDWSTYTLISRERTGKRISGALHEKTGLRTRFGVIVGASTLECGVNPSLLGPDSEIPLRWLSLSGRASTATDMEAMAESVFQEGLRPEVLILAINPTLVARADDYLGDADSDVEGFDLPKLLSQVRAGQWREACSDATFMPRGILRLAFPQRKRVAFRLQYLTLLARTAIFRSLGLGAAVIFPPEPEPWVVNPEWANGPHLSGEAIAAMMEGFRQRGWFEAARYAAENTQTQALVRLSQRCRTLKIKQLIVLMPETSKFVALVPPEAEQSIASALRAALGAEAPPIVDLRHSIPDEQFRDPLHVDRSAREILSRHYRSILLDLIDQTRLARR
jgi:hypothetical protein